VAMDPSGDRQRVGDTGRRGRRQWLLDGLEETRAYRKLKEEALVLPVRRTDFGMKETIDLSEDTRRVDNSRSGTCLKEMGRTNENPESV